MDADIKTVVDTYDACSSYLRPAAETSTIVKNLLKKGTEFKVSYKRELWMAQLTFEKSITHVATAETFEAAVNRLNDMLGRSAV